MDINRLKRDFFALLIIIPVLIVLAFITSWAGIKTPIFWHDFDASAPNITQAGDKLTRIVDLSGKWHIAVGDDHARATEAIDHASWATIDVPEYWENEGYDGYDGFAWYRRTFELKGADLDQTLFLLLGRVDDADEVYINGSIVGRTGSFPPNYSGAWSQDRKYAIPSELLREGENLIAVRVYDAHQNGGIYKGNIGLYASLLPKPLVSLEGQWHFRIDTEEDFQMITVPGTWESQGYENYNGVATYQKTFGQLDLNNDEPLVLLLGKIDDTDEVRLNDTIIGRTGQLNSQALASDSKYYLINRHYEFSPSLLDAENLLEVRVYDGTGKGGIYEGPVAIMTKSDFLDYSEKLARSK